MSGRSAAEREARRAAGEGGLRVPMGSATVRQRDENYYVVRLPSELVNDSDLSHGDRVEQEYDPESNEVCTRLE